MSSFRCSICSVHHKDHIFLGCDAVSVMIHPSVHPSIRRSFHQSVIGTVIVSFRVVPMTRVRIKLHSPFHLVRFSCLSAIAITVHTYVPSIGLSVSITTHPCIVHRSSVQVLRSILCLSHVHSSCPFSIPFHVRFHVYVHVFMPTLLGSAVRSSGGRIVLWYLVSVC